MKANASNLFNLLRFRQWGRAQRGFLLSESQIPGVKFPVKQSKNVTFS
jgi:hypothetical protein